MNEERVLKEDAWERLLKVDPDKISELEGKLDDERLNSKEMLRELRALRAEKDAVSTEARALTEERNMLRNEVQLGRSASDFEQQGLRGAMDSLQQERMDALGKLQSMRQDYANLDSQVSQSNTDNHALMAQLKFLTQQLQARQNTESAVTPSSILKNNPQQSVHTMMPLPPMPSYTAEDAEQDTEMQARFYEQQVRVCM